MQKDFHYYCIGVLSRAAGFNPKDALILAYASQYVDDATEPGLFELEDGVPGPHFDATRTSYFGLESLHSLRWEAQKRVWIPFHFIPDMPFSPASGSDFDFVTGPGSDFARLLLTQAAAEPLANRERRLCRIGVALHTYADTWAHQDFSGCKNQEENDVEAIYVYDRESGEWDHLKLGNLILDALPAIGHAEAGFFPDLAFQRWKCVIGEPPRPIERDNVDLFGEAAEEIYTRLLAMEKTDPEEPIPWPEVAPRISALLAEEGARPSWPAQVSTRAYRDFQAADVTERCENWRAEFGCLFEPSPEEYFYDKYAWRAAAVAGPVDWDDYSLREWEQMAPREAKPGFWDSLWVHFHRAALRQRHFVLERLP
jgi:hypothetical protein